MLCLCTSHIKAYRDFGSHHPEYTNLLKGCPIQGKRAKELHDLVGVPEGPCGIAEIETFQAYLSDYQIVVVSVEHGYQIIYKGPDKPEDKLLVIIKVGDHFHT